MKDKAQRNALLADFLHRDGALMNLHSAKMFDSEEEVLRNKHKDSPGSEVVFQNCLTKVRNHSLHPLAGKESLTTNANESANNM